MSRWAGRVFGSFPATAKLARAEWVGNPIRRNLASFDRASLLQSAQERYVLEPGRPVVGVFGGSLGAAVLNRLAGQLAQLTATNGFSLLHLTGSNAFEATAQLAAPFPAWRAIAFEDRMDFFYAACDLIIARAGGAVAELTATATPSILVPGGFGSGGHQRANAAQLAGVGAAIAVNESDIAGIPAIVERLVVDGANEAENSLSQMKVACSKLARPDAASVIAAAMRAAHG
jgi:UDP-N-acetylglucosamine--N-acetylmuramyl-(pentapeptide) pyrophosphoryl-undecaprenol N-acetylglucosamine transferase